MGFDTHSEVKGHKVSFVHKIQKDIASSSHILHARKHTRKKHFGAVKHLMDQVH